MNELSHYYTKLFKLAKRYDKNRKRLLYLTLFLLSISIYLSGYILYAFSCIALICQIVSWLYKTKIEDINSLAHDLHNIHIIAKAYGNVPSKFELSHLLSKVSLWIDPKDDEITDNENVDGAIFSSDDDEFGNKKLIKLVHENCYWNHYMYKYTYKRNVTILSISLFFISMAFLLFFPFVKISPNYDFIRLIFTFLSFAIMYEFLESTLLLKKASDSMLEMDNDLSRNNVLNEHILLNTFSRYVHLKRIVPSPPDNLHVKYQDILNKGWSERAMKNL